jgi:hypothetical protein
MCTRSVYLCQAAGPRQGGALNQDDTRPSKPPGAILRCPCGGRRTATPPRPSPSKGPPGKARPVARPSECSSQGGNRICHCGFCSSSLATFFTSFSCAFVRVGVGRVRRSKTASSRSVSSSRARPPLFLHHLFDALLERLEEPLRVEGAGLIVGDQRLQPVHEVAASGVLGGAPR